MTDSAISHATVMSRIEKCIRDGIIALHIPQDSVSEEMVNASLAQKMQALEQILDLCKKDPQIHQYVTEQLKAQ